MLRRHLPLIAVILYTACLPGVAGAITGDEIVEKALKLRREIRDYTATVTVRTDIPDVDIPDRTVTVYFKQPDKIRVISDGLVILPRKALNIHSLGTRLIEKADAVVQGSKTVDGRTLYSVKLIPQSEKDPNRAIVSVWGDTWTVHRVEGYKGPSKIFTVRWTHQKVGGKHWLPRTIVFQSVAEDLPGSKSGTLTLRFSDFRVNTGLSDEIFKQKQ